MAYVDKHSLVSEMAKWNSGFVEQKLAYKDALHTQPLEIAYKTAVMQSAAPSQKMVKEL